jgi:5-methylcytosine-specific restriction endonuclease McrA
LGRLTNLKPRLSSLPPRIGYAPGDEKARDKQRTATQHWRAWYKTARWEKLRQQVLIRDLYTCQRTGVLCIGKSPAPNSPVVNHKRPHRGDPFLFWDIDNLETVTKAVHDGLIQSEERRHG